LVAASIADDTVAPGFSAAASASEKSTSRA
jgi:hypothetical protein